MKSDCITTCMETHPNGIHEDRGVILNIRKKNHGDKLVPLERSRRTIQLEKRGRKLKRYAIPSRIFAVLGIACILYCAGIALAGFGTYFFLLWGAMGVFWLLLSAIFHNEKLMRTIPGWMKGICTGIFCAGLLLFCSVEGLILSQYNAQAGPGADYVIVLGAQWKSTGPSEVLRRRLIQAANYLASNPDTKVIVSGGQGDNEIMSEAAGMKEYLIKTGIEEERILVEDKSANTYENLTFSGQLLDIGQDSVVIVTNNFHMFRALSIAKKQGYADVEGLAASSVLGMGPNNLLREFLGVLKDFWVGNL